MLRKIYLFNYIAALCLLMLSNTGFAIYRAGPGPGLFDYLDKTDLILVGKAEKVKTLELSGFFSGFEYYFPSERIVTKVFLVKFDEAYLISAEGTTQIDRPIYQYVFQRSIIYYDKRGVYFLSNQKNYPRIEYSFSINADESVGFISEWDGNGKIHRIEKTGHLLFVHPKKNRSPISYDEFELAIKKYLNFKSKEPAIINPLLFCNCSHGGGI